MLLILYTLRYTDMLTRNHTCLYRCDWLVLELEKGVKERNWYCVKQNKNQKEKADRRHVNDIPFDNMMCPLSNAQVIRKKKCKTLFSSNMSN